MKREENEPFAEYQTRRKNERNVLDVYLRGRNIKPGNGTNRADLRSKMNRAKGYGADDPLRYHRAKLRRVKKAIVKMLKRLWRKKK